MITNNKVALVALFAGASVAIHAVNPPQSTTPSTPKKPNAETMHKDTNTNIAINDIVSNNNVTIDLTVRVIDTMEAMQKSKKGAELTAQLDKQRLALTEEIKKLDQKIVQAKTEFKSKDSTMSNAARSTEEAKIVKMTRELENMVKTSEEELKIAMQQATNDLLNDLQVAVAEVAKEDKIDMVQDRSGQVLYVSEKAMITSKLVNKMDKAHVAANKKAAQPATTTKVTA